MNRVQAAAQALSRHGLGSAWAQGSGLTIPEPWPSKAEPKPGLSGRAGPAHH